MNKRSYGLKKNPETAKIRGRILSTTYPTYATHLLLIEKLPLYRNRNPT